MELVLAIELAFFALFAVKQGFARIERDVLRKPTRLEDPD
jgi:hypothetical protein